MLNTCNIQKKILSLQLFLLQYYYKWIVFKVRNIFTAPVKLVDVKCAIDSFQFFLQ